MAFVAEAAARRLGALATMPMPVARNLAISGTRTFTTSMAAQKTAAETVKDGLKGVDRAVSDKIVDGIDIGSTLASKIKEAGEEVTAGKPTGKAAELRGEAKGKASELSGEAKGAAHEAAGKVKGKADEVQGKL